VRLNKDILRNFGVNTTYLNATGNEGFILL